MEIAFNRLGLEPSFQNAVSVSHIKNKVILTCSMGGSGGKASVRVKELCLSRLVSNPKTDVGFFKLVLSIYSHLPLNFF